MGAIGKVVGVAALAVVVGVVYQAWSNQNQQPKQPKSYSTVEYYSAEEAAAALSRSPEHLAPTGRGQHGSYSWSEKYTAPFELSNRTLAWSWSHKWGRFWTLTYGTTMDHEMNIYLTGADAIRKFSPDGELLWEHQTWAMGVPTAGRNMDTTALYKGALYSQRTDGYVYALNIENGNLIWKTKVSDDSKEDNGLQNVFDGVVVMSTDSHDHSFSRVVRALNASDGRQMWMFTPEKPLWNFMASFPGDGTVVFQDIEAKAYRLKLQTGELIWKVGGNPNTWTDATMSLGPNNVVYAVGTRDWQGAGHKYSKGDLWAYRLSDGHQLWRKEIDRVPNVAPAIGKLYGKKKFSVVQAAGQQVLQGADTYVYAFDAETAELQWTFDGPVQKGVLQAGDMEGSQLRKVVLGRELCLPNPWGAPVIDAAGTVYIGSEEGPFYALRDVNGDGKVQGPDEVSVFETYAAFAGSAAPVLGPGMVAVSSCDSLFVFKDPKAKHT